MTFRPKCIGTVGSPAGAAAHDAASDSQNRSFCRLHPRDRDTFLVPRCSNALKMKRDLS
jgi:hypothetical protein